MSVLIKGFVIPTKREDCPLCDYEEGVCLAWLNVKDDDEIRHCIQGVHPPKDRPEWCPLIELPDHGDLIDRSMLIGGFADWYIQESPMYLGDSNVVAETIGDAMKAIEAAPAVIPAERSEE